jgi:hyperosmotically inducible periplasmic protein
MRCKLLVLAILALPSIVCSQTPRQIPPQAVERIVKEVRHELIMLPYYGVFDDIKYSVNGYDVTLMGQVTNPTLKKDAGRAVQHIEGVEQG